MNDRELLELAAKVAGVYLEWDGPPTQWQPMYYQGKTYHSWNPLTDDGDALRLAVKMGVDMYFGDDEGTTTANVGAALGEGKPFRYCVEPLGDDPHAATRRAIVRAAAEIGKGMK